MHCKKNEIYILSMGPAKIKFFNNRFSKKNLKKKKIINMDLSKTKNT